LLLDTHVILWWISGSKRLSRKACKAIVADDAQLFVSVVAGWEYMMKLRRKKLPIFLTFDAAVKRLRLSPLALAYEQHLHAVDLPDIHRDPFDRMMIAQALDHDLIFVTSDETIHRYPVRTLW